MTRGAREGMAPSERPLKRRRPDGRQTVKRDVTTQVSHKKHKKTAEMSLPASDESDEDVSPKRTGRLGSDRSSGSGSQSASSGDESDEKHEDGSASEEEDEEAIKAAQLVALARHQASFLAQLGGAPSSGSAKTSIKRKDKGKTKQIVNEEDEDLAVSLDSGSDSTLASGEGFDEDDDFEFTGFGPVHGSGDVGDIDDGGARGAAVETVVFAASGSGARAGGAEISKADRKRFMSAKSSNFLDVVGASEQSNMDSAKRKAVTAEDDEDENNLKLDKTLHHLLHTQLLPQASDPSRPVEKRNAIAGRLLELAAIAPLGQGTAHHVSSTRARENVSLRLKSAIDGASARRADKAREEAREAGSWVRGIGGLEDGPGSRARTGTGQRGKDRGKERDRGLSGGIGRFKDGVLTLSKREVAMGNATPEEGGRRGKGGRGGRGGRGRGRGR